MKKEHFLQLLFALISALVSGLGVYYFNNQPEKSISLEYRQHTLNNLKSAFGDVDDIQITYKNKLLEKISNTRFYIRNNSDKNIDEFKLYFEIKSKDDLPLFHTVTVPETYPEDTVKLISKDNGVFVFVVKYFNRDIEIWNDLEFTFFFAGLTPPEIQVKTGTKGMIIKKQGYNKRSTLEITQYILARTWWLLILIIVCFYTLIKTMRIIDKLYMEDFNTALREVIKNNKQLSDNEKIEQIKERYQKEISLKRIFQNWSNRDS